MYDKFKVKQEKLLGKDIVLILTYAAKILILNISNLFANRICDLINLIQVYDGSL